MGYYIDLIRRYGIGKCLLRVICSPFYLLLSRLYLPLLRRFSQIDEDKFLFSSSPSFSDNAKALYDYLRTRDDMASRKFVWLIDMNDPIPQIQDENTVFVRRRVFYHSGMPFPTLREVATSKYQFFTHGSPAAQIGGKRPGQFVVNLWHGCGYKDIQKSSTRWIDKNPCDVSIVPGTVFIGTKAKFWGCDESCILPIGYPRYDLFFREEEHARRYAEVLRGDSTKLVMWMPTFRKTRKGQYPESKIEGHFELPVLQSEEQLAQLNQTCREKKIAVCIKRHPAQVEYGCEKNAYSNIRFISNTDLSEVGVDLYALLRYTDALISDYSSIAIDYLLLNRPIAFTLDDFEEYQAARGFVFDDPLHYMPGHHLYRYEDLCVFLEDTAAGADRYATDRAAIMPEVHNPCDNYCERVWEMSKRFMDRR